MKEPLHILHLEDDPLDAELVRRILKKNSIDHKVELVDSRQAYLDQLQSGSIDLVLADYTLPDFNGLEALDELRKSNSFIPFIFVTGTMGEEQAVESLHRGANDYIIKDRLQRLPAAITKAIRYEKHRKDLHDSQKALLESEAYYRDFVETSPDWVWRMDENWIINHSNNKYMNIHHDQKTDITGTSFFDLITNMDRNKVQNQIRENPPNENGSYDFEVTCPHNPDCQRIFELRIIPHSLPKKTREYLGVCRDITIQKNREDVLEKKAKRAQLMMELPRDSDLKTESELIQFSLSRLGSLLGSLGATLLIYNEEEPKVLLYHIRRDSDSYPWDPVHKSSVQKEIFREEIFQKSCALDKEITPVFDTAMIKDKNDYYITVSSAEHPLWKFVGLTSRKEKPYTDTDRETLKLVVDQISRMVVVERQIKEMEYSQDRLKEAQYLAQMGYWYWDRERQKLDISDSGVHILSSVFPDMKVCWQNLRKSMLQVQRDLLFHDLYRCKREGLSFQREIKLFSESKEIWLSFRAQSILGDEESTTGLHGTFQDITERTQKDERIKTLAAIIEQSPETIVLTNLDATLRYVNQAFVDITGYSREEALGLNPRVLQSGKTPRKTFDQMWETLTAGNIWEGEMINRRKDGSEYIEHAILLPLKNSEGKVEYYAGIKEDITEKKRMARDLEEYRQNLEDKVEERTEQLRQALIKANEATRAKQAFLANISHDLRTPLSAILGMMYLLRKTDLTSVQLEFIEKISISSNYLLSLINDILDLSKMESGKLILSKGKVSISQIVEKVEEMIIERVREKNLEFSIDSDDFDRSYIGDPVRITQALTNLVQNAVKFTDKGFVKIKVLRMTEEDGFQTIRFEVKDSGVGFKQSEASRLFSSFEQENAATSKKFGGTGLGLSITRLIAQQMQGDVGAESSYGNGSLFWFSVRLKEMKPEEESFYTAKDSMASNAVQDKNQYQGKRALLAEDDDFNMEISKNLLEEYGLQVITAVNGREAVDAVDENPVFDIIFMDMQMPLLDGLQAVSIIRKKGKGQGVPIIALTANAFVEDRDSCISAGMSDFLTKPIEHDKLNSCINQWLGFSRDKDTKGSLNKGLDKILALDWVDSRYINTSFTGKTDFYLSTLRRFCDR
ncbi:MAG: response regulator, partial [Spirochaetales bacterium]|nr:response regulator [Spirochaetales bacterium]